MGFFDRDVENAFDRMLFDWNRDGKLDSFEAANQFAFIQEFMEESESEHEDSPNRQSGI